MDNPDTDSWFSCRVRFAQYSDSGEFLLYRTSVYLVRAVDYDQARVKAMDVGRREEKFYPNADGAMARTALAEIEALDMIDDVVDGVEVACMWSDEITPSPYPFDYEFHPEMSRPTNTL